MLTATVTSELSEETEDTRPPTDSAQPPDITMYETVGVANADVSGSTITANASTAESADDSGTSGYHNCTQDHTPTFPGMKVVADCTGIDQVDVCNTENTTGVDLSVVDNGTDIVRDEFVDKEIKKYPSDRGHFYATVTDMDIRRKIVRYGPCQPLISFPPNEKGRRFPVDYYFAKTKTGIKIKRQWLCDSVLTNKVYCEFCWLFANRNSVHFRSG